MSTSDPRTEWTIVVCPRCMEQVFEDGYFPCGHGNSPKDGLEPKAVRVAALDAVPADREKVAEALREADIRFRHDTPNAGGASFKRLADAAIAAMRGSSDGR